MGGGGSLTGSRVYFCLFKLGAAGGLASFQSSHRESARVPPGIIYPPFDGLSANIIVYSRETKELRPLRSTWSRSKRVSAWKEKAPSG